MARTRSCFANDVCYDLVRDRDRASEQVGEIGGMGARSDGKGCAVYSIGAAFAAERHSATVTSAILQACLIPIVAHGPAWTRAWC